MNHDSLPTADGSNDSQSTLRAEDVLLKMGKGFKTLSRLEKRNIVVAFARLDKPVYGEAFDMIQIDGDVDLEDEDDVKQNIGRITLIEIKSTKKKKANGADLNCDFDGYFFGLTTAELLVAQKLQDKYRFVLVNLNTGFTKTMSLKDIFAQAKAIYPQWSIRF